jgi:hypothetical protein
MADDPKTPTADGILQQLANAIRGLPNHDEVPPTSGGRVPYERFHAVVAENKALREQMAGFQPQIEKMQQGHAAALEALKQETAESLKTISQRNAEEIGMVESGLTDLLGRQTLRAAWEMAPKDARGKSPVEFWNTMREAHAAHQADPENVQAPEIPKALSAYLPQREAPKQGARQPANTRTAAHPPTGVENMDVSGMSMTQFVQALQKQAGGA